MSLEADIRPIRLRLMLSRRWSPDLQRELRIEDKRTSATLSEEDTRNLQTGVVTTARIASSVKRGRSYWVHTGHGFDAPADAEISDIAAAFERLRATSSNIPVRFS